jgi:hypothetical protein
MDNVENRLRVAVVPPVLVVFYDGVQPFGVHVGFPFIVSWESKAG